MVDRTGKAAYPNSKEYKQTRDKGYMQVGRQIYFRE